MTNCDSYNSDCKFLYIGSVRLFNCLIRVHLGSAETSGIEQTSKTQNSEDRQKQNVTNKQTPKQQPSKQRAEPAQDKEQHLYLFQNIQQEIPQFETSNSQQSNSQQYEVQKHSYYNFAQETTQSQMHAPPQDNFPTGEVYLGINAIPSEIYRIENIRGNQGHIYNSMCAQNEGHNFSRVATEKNGQDSSSQVYSNHFETYHIKGQPGQGQFLGHYQGQTVSQGEAQYVSQSYQGKVLYQASIHQGEGQSSNQGHFESSSLGQPQGQNYFHDKSHQNQGHQGEVCQGQPGHPGQGQPGHPGQGQQSKGHESQGHQGQGQRQGYFKDYQYEIHNHSQDYSSQNQVNHSGNQNINYSHASGNNNYLYTESMSIGRHASQDSSSTSHSNFPEKTALPSFFQLSSQLSSNTRVSAGY